MRRGVLLREVAVCCLELEGVKDDAIVRALSALEQARHVFRSVGNREFEADASFKLGVIHRKLASVNLAAPHAKLSAQFLLEALQHYRGRRYWVQRQLVQENLRQLLKLAPESLGFRRWLPWTWL